MFVLLGSEADTEHRENKVWRDIEREITYAAQGGKCGSLHQPGFSSVNLFTWYI